jgi:diguanylate cyclase (GGDEF)-like protein
MRKSVRPTIPSRVALIFIGLGLLASVCLVDHSSGNSPALGVFYLVPIYFVAWFVDEASGILFSLITYYLMALGDSGFNFSSVSLNLGSLSYLSALAFFIVTSIMFSRLNSAYKRERALSSHDYLTDVFNRREFFHLAEVERLRALRYGRALTIVFIDLDDFKSVNDRFGHAAGDVMLSTVARTVKSCIRATDIIARLGGDEFILLLEETDSDSARVIVNKLREGLADELAQSAYKVTASMGVMTFVIPPVNVDEMVSKADELMYAAKHSGGDRAVYRVSSGDLGSRSAQA